MNDSIPEDKSNRFLRLAERRTSQALKKMRLIGNLANRHNYSYTDEQVRQVLDALESAIREVKSRFRQETSSPRPTFSFKK